ncbi:hypothetical protein [Nostoc sp.]|uniref:hypothetical protein n=1 Tax=Nostoc sp. TaxID=1180 RepID=UPI002FF59D1F
MYPNQLTLETLESQHCEYVQLLPALQEIDLLVSGGFKLKNSIRQFLSQRPGEESEIYETRIKKYTYLNILSSSINQQVAKLANATLTIDGLETAPDFWAEFRENTNLSGRSEKELITLLFREVLKFKKIFVHADKPQVDVVPQNKLQEESLGIRPYVITYSPLQVTNWSESKGKLSWIKVRQITEDTSNPLAPAQKIATWTFIDGSFVAKYSAIVELDCKGNISKISNENANPKSTVALVSLIEHGFGEIPVLKLELPDELWICDQAASKALEHLRTDCAKYDLLTLAYFQRTFKRIQTPDSDLEHTYTNDEPIPTGLQHVIELEKFEWAEPRGYIVQHMSDSLKAIEDQVRDLISSGGVSATHGAITQSGISKKLDFHKQEVQLKSYGEKLCDFYQDVLELVAVAAGINGDNISVTGLNSFEDDTLDSLLLDLDDISKLDVQGLKAKLPPTIFNIVYEQLVSLLAGNLSAPQKEQVKKEIATLFQPGTLL